MRAVTSDAATSPTGTLIQNTHCHASPPGDRTADDRAPRTAGPVTPPSAPIALPRVSGGKAALTSDSDSEARTAAAPWTARAAISSPEASAQPMDASENISNRT